MNVAANISVQGELRANESMALHTSWRAGGPARRYFEPADVDDLIGFLRELPEQEPLLWLGLGSNLLVRDGGFPGTIVALYALDGRIEPANDGQLEVGSGVHCARLAKYCADQGLVGGNFFIGIPGSVGGALAMNAGAYGGETWQRVIAVEMVDRRGRVSRHEQDEFETDYRHVVPPVNEGCYLRAWMRFDAGDRDTLKNELREMLASRRETQPVGQPSCGSVFRNPPGDHAARLIEASGLKGYAIGNAQVSEKHANFIINTGDARADDIEDLLLHVQAVVEREHGVVLQPEVRIVGERAHE